MNYIIIMPAYNEAERIGDTLASLAGQTLLPRRLLVVNDGSTDETAEIVKGFARQYSWIRLINNPVKPEHSPGAKIVRAFYAAYETVEEDYEFLVKLDADLLLPAHYFERISEMFQDNARLGIAGGVLYIEQDGQLVYETLSDTDHVRGAYKAYRKACFEDIGGLKASIGWDTLDELLALYHGWERQTDPGLRIIHKRVTGQESGSLRVKVKAGVGMFRMRYGLLIMLISAAKLGLLLPPYILSGLAVVWGFFKAWLRGDEFMVSREEGDFIRHFRRSRMLGKVIGKSRK